MAVDYPALLGALDSETGHLLDFLATTTATFWRAPTPAAGWTVHDQLSHLAFFDDFAYLALTDADRFRVDAAELTALGTDFPDRVAERHRHLTRRELQAWFTESRRRLLTAFAEDDPRRRLPWFGPDMSVASAATARLMETWAHGQDIYDTAGVAHPPASGLRSIAHLGVSTFAFAHRLHGLSVPEQPVRVELTAPGTGELWTWGPAGATDRVIGPAADFVLAITQRRHVADTALTVHGDVATRWMTIAQAYAGAPGTGRPQRNTNGREEFHR
ncbi:TIGR03084 family metal-binding protein [Nocardia sp. alder85J]|uniref:TIGR03084 family metal-binding protein n=1 Tax=Nocardia sp. alder85J TaxID=2862949 RepID=UPI001CD383D5|nr:TIGR03084 family metal-binding protein [Nocardia sp. alder85J]MCX4094446.1 TIGR03084 family metal-binding protein [Nocardia sp. alder85J]